MTEIAKSIRKAAVAIIMRGEKFLAIKRSQTVRAPGKICFPGGGVESGESIEQALIREMKEELNISIKPREFVWQSCTERGFELNWWKADLEGRQTIIPNLDEVESYDWLTQAEMISNPNLLDSNLNFFQARDAGRFEL
ncbi:MAG: NUDIX hydrolase [Mariniblastus sp.]|nr:NUDIX hydrolase [Mariniblastus sp.]